MHLKTVREVTFWFPGEPIDKWRLFLENIFLNSLIIMEASRKPGRVGCACNPDI